MRFEKIGTHRAANEVIRDRLVPSTGADRPAIVAEFPPAQISSHARRELTCSLGDLPTDSGPGPSSTLPRSWG
jgi:hypothetical protein